MATIQINIAPICDTVANFKAIGQAVENALSAAGYARTADTGQVNWATISSVPTAVGTYFVMVSPADGFTPYYLRFDFFASSTDPRMRVIIGTGTNGTGTITGLTFTSSVLGNNGGASALLSECNFSYGAGRFALMLFRSAANSGVPQFIAFERSRNASGAPTGTYVTLVVAGATSVTGSTNQVSIIFGVVLGPNTSPMVLGDSFAGSSAIISGQIPISPVFPVVGFFDYPLLCAASARQGDFAEGATVTTSLYGSPATYIASKTGQGFQRFGPANNTSSCLLMRFE